jgi:hypothetical protein
VSEQECAHGGGYGQWHRLHEVGADELLGADGGVGEQQQDDHQRSGADRRHPDDQASDDADDDREQRARMQIVDRRVPFLALEVHGGADRPHHHRGDQIAGDGGGRLDAEQEDQHRRHQGSPARARHADEQTDDRASQNDVRIDVHADGCGSAGTGPLPPSTILTI